MPEKHLGIYWNPNGKAEDAAAAKEWAAKAATDVEIIVETDINRAQRLAEIERDRLAFVIAKAGTADQPSGQSLLTNVLEHVGAHIFTILYSRTLSSAPSARLAEADQGIHMVTHRPDEMITAIRRLTAHPTLPERLSNEAQHKYTCPICGIKNLDSIALWEHMPLFHVAVKKTRSSHKCPICDAYDSTIVVHVHDEHAPPGTPKDTSRSGIPLYSFGLVVVRRKRDGKFLVVQEYGSQGYWLPGGGIDAGEMPDKAAARECLEEAGVKIKLTGLLRVEVSPSGRACRMRYIFYGEPEDEGNCEPKTLPDFESAGACWVTAEEISSGKLRVRGYEPQDWFNYVAKGGAIHPIEMLTWEGAEAPCM